MTIQQIADREGKSTRTIQRWIEAYQRATGKNRTDFDKTEDYIEAIRPKQSDSTTTVLNRIGTTDVIVSTPPPSQNGFKKPTQKATKPISRAKKNEATKDGLFKNSVVIIVNAAVLILVDAVSFGWIAYNVYPEFYLAAVPIFAVAGMSVGYAAFTSILSGKKWDSEAWIVGFMFFQIALHLCAMQAIGEYSFLVGKIVIALGLPMGSIGLALALKNMKDEK